MAALRDTLNDFARQFALALQRATRLQPGAAVGAAETPDDDLVHGSTRHLPGAGWLVGLVAAFVFALAALALRGNPVAPAVAAVLALFATIVLTGGAQESAVYRVAEGLGARAPSPGGFGTMALVLLLAGRITAVAAIGVQSEAGVLAALFAAPVLSRFAPLLAQHWLADAPRIDRFTVQVAGAWCVVPLLLMAVADNVVFLLLALLGAVVAWIAMLRLFRKEAGPFGDDRAASLQQACEVAFYLGAAVAA